MVRFTIQFTGVGSAFSQIHYNNGILIEVDGKKYLLDCGVTAPYALRDLGVSLGDIEGIIISHIHADHTGGLEHFGFQGMYKYNKKFKLYVAEDLAKRLWDNTLAGGMEEIAGGVGTLESFFDVITFRSRESFWIEALEVAPIKTVHVTGPNGQVTKPSYSFVLDNRVFYSADCIFNRELLEQMQDMEAIFHDCQLFSVPASMAVHASIDELETLPEHIRSKVKAMHYGDDYEQFEERFKRSGIERVRQFQKFSF